jgi:polyhydroxyalkanoate synthesis regulator protein
MFEKQARANMDMFENAMRMFTPGAMARKSKRDDRATSPSDEMMEMLRAQMAAMQEQLDSLSKR